MSSLYVLHTRERRRSRTLLLAAGILSIFLCAPIWGRSVLSYALAATLPAFPINHGLGPSSRKRLRFTRDGTFQLTVFEDLHYGEAEDLSWGPLQDIYTERVINTILDEEKPQLVVLNGDLITGENTQRDNSSLYIDEIVRPLVQRGLSWASTYGNHDSDFNLSREAILEREQRYPSSLTQNMVSSEDGGLSNYYLPVYSSDPKFLKPALLLWFFDSRGGGAYQEKDANGKTVGLEDWVHTSVVQWFRDTSSKLGNDYGGPIPSLAFFHIPVNAMAVFQQVGVNANREPGINDDNPLAQQSLTYGDDADTYGGQDIPFMQAMLDTPGLMAAFSGHDHGDDWCFKWKTKLPGMNLRGNGLHLCFGRHTGYGGYGTWTRGSRQILINEKTLGKSTETWIRLEDRTVSGRVVLNSTYGSDEYAQVPNGHTRLPV